jgi:hypothetical protein
MGAWNDFHQYIEMLPWVHGCISLYGRDANFSHTQPLFQQLDILNFEQLATQSKLHFMHSVNYGYSLPSFSNTGIKNNQRDH